MHGQPGALCFQATSMALKKDVYPPRCGTMYPYGRSLSEEAGSMMSRILFIVPTPFKGGVVLRVKIRRGTVVNFRAWLFGMHIRWT